jgi:hypothetical protein
MRVIKVPSAQAPCRLGLPNKKPRPVVRRDDRGFCGPAFLWLAQEMALLTGRGDPFPGWRLKLTLGCDVPKEEARRMLNTGLQEILSN